MTTIRWQDSSTWRFFRYSLACFIAIIFIFTISYSILHYHREKDYLDDALRNIADTHVPALIAGLWITDDADVQRTVNAMARFRYITRVEVRNDAGRLFVSGTAASPLLEVASRPLTYVHKDTSIAIGSLSLFINQRQMVLHVFKSALFLLLMQIASALILAGVIAGAFHHAFGRHLHRFAQFVKSDEPARFDHPYALARKRLHQDELQLLVDHFNDLRRRIGEYMGKLAATNDELTAINLQLLENERQLRTSEAQFAGAFEHASIGMALVSPAGCWLKVNQALCAMLGYASDTLKVMMREDVIHPDDRDVDQFQRTRLLAGQIATYRMENRCRHHSGRFIWALRSVSLVRDHEARPLHFVVQFVDITERKQAEAARVALEDQNRRLQKAESLGRMAGAIAHHFNNQLGAVMGNLEMALEDLPADDPAHGNVAEAMRAAQRSAQISGLMLTYLGQNVGRPTPLDLAEVCRQTLPLLRGPMPEAIALETDWPANGPVALAAADQIRQILTHLITNAVEAIGTSAGTVTLAITTVAAPDIPKTHLVPADWTPFASTYACLSVTDTGCGVAAENMDNLFDPFFTTKFTGRGLGLAVVLGIVRAWDGAIGVASPKYTGGSTFSIYLPLVEEPLPARS